MSYIKRALSIDDFDNYLIVKSDAPAILWSGFATAPNPDNLKPYFERIINNPDIYIYFLFEEGSDDIIGYGQIVKENDNEVLYAGNSIRQVYQGKGYSKIITALIIDEVRKLGVDKICGWISEHNAPSYKSVLSAGFIKTDVFKMIRLEAFDREDRFYLYEKVL